MAQKLDFALPFNDLTQYVPQNLRNPVIKGLVENLFNRFMTRDESVPFYGYVGRKPTSTDDHTSKVPQSTVERDVNAVIPVLNFQLGKIKHAFTVQDLIHKAEVLGVSSGGQEWLYSQANNYLPPIDIDRFANFYNYYWIADALPTKPSLSWNTENLPEYYTIASPKPGDHDKLNVQVATTQPIVLTGTGFEDQSFTIKFTSPTTFSITASVGLGSWGPQAQNFVLTSNNQHIAFDVSNGTTTVRLVEFDIVREPVYNSGGTQIGTQDFATNDEYLLDTSFLSRNYALAPVSITPSTTSKGAIKNVFALSRYQTIDGVQVKEGQRVLVLNNGSSNGIYVVSPQAWNRSSDYSGATIQAGAKVWVKEGIVNQGKLFTSGAGNSWPPGVVAQSNTNDWQESNYWIHASQLDSYNLTRTDVTQAVRPIIEYHSDLQLNSRFQNGLPSDVGILYKQHKTDFNQIPLFDLFRYDGTHSGLVSAVFYYVEDPTADLDLDLQKRVKVSGAESSDYIFNHGCVDDAGDMLFFKKSGSLKSIWHAGYSAATVIDQTFISAIPLTSGQVKGTLSNLVAHNFTQQQVWTLQALSSSTFKVSGSKTNSLPTPYDILTVGIAYSNVDFSCLITAGSTAFTAGDTFIFRIGSLETPRYVYRDSTDQIFDFYGGRLADSSGIGAYQVPRPFTNNPYNSSRAEVAEGTLYSHFRSILQNQLTEISSDYAFGGSVKNWSEQQTLLASLLMQRDLTPISMIDLTQRQYDTALNSIADTYQQIIADYFSAVGVVALDGSAQQREKLNNLLDHILELRRSDNDVRTVLYDSTAAVVGFPITLPQLGILDLVEPTITYDTVLGRDLLVHHDGHNSTLYIDNIDFRRAVLNNNADTLVVRSDGSSTPAVGSFTNTPPTLPYKGTLWIRPAGNSSQLLAFDVDYDDEPTTPVITGQSLFDRGSGTLKIWSGTQWVSQPNSAAAWKQVDLAATLNELLLLVEKRLYNGINPNIRKVDFTPLMSSATFKTQLERELFSYAAVKGLAPLGSDYIPQNSFTWNYSQASLSNFPALATSAVPARWYNVLKAHQSTVSGVIPTERPNLEPWKLLGFSSYATWWASLSSSQQTNFTPFAKPSELGNGTFTVLGDVRAIKTTFGVTTKIGTQVIDGVALVAGDLVLLQNEAGPENNGIWAVSAGNWTRSTFPLVEKGFVFVTEGATGINTIWALSQAVPTVNTSPVLFKQVRLWTNALWQHIQSQRPTLRLSVDTFRDALLPPYINSALIQASNALTTVSPSGVAAEYHFGDGGPVEAVWLSSIDFGYGLAKALFRHDPLLFIGFCWGFNWVEVDNILYDGYDVNSPGHKRFRLHGDLNRVIPRGAETVITGAGTAYTIVYDAYEVDSNGRYQNFSVRNSAGEAIGYVREGVQATVGGLSIKIEDSGKPFHIGDKFVVAASGEVTFVPAVRHQYLGFGQVFTGALRELSIDTQDSYAIDAFRNWEVNMGHRAGGLVATDNLKVRTDTDTLTSSSYELLFKKNEIAKDLWVQALRITVTQFGAARSTPAGQVASGTGNDWVFRIEGYNPRFNNLSYYNLSTSSGSVTFQALAGEKTDLVWLQPTLVTGVSTTYLPLSITGIQNVVNFLFGYSKFVEAQGWEFNKVEGSNNIDHETGRARTWQLEIEKFIDRCYRGIELNQGHIVNPFSDQIWLRQNSGLLAEFKDTALFDITGHPAVFDIAGVKMSSADIFATRGNLVSSIGAVAPMYSVHAQVDEFEHLFVFKNFVEASIQNGVLYDAFSGGRVVTYKFNGRRQASATFRPEFGGHYLVGAEVRQNLQASTDNIANFYDANKVFENETSSKHALALLGFHSKDYFNDLDISDKSQFNFWRGLVQAKGTNLSIGAYLNNNRFSDAKIDEYWAYKVAEYGDSRQRTFPELKLNVDDTIQQFTQLQFDAGVQLPNFTQIDRFDENRWFSLDDLDHDAYFKAEQVGSYSAAHTTGDIIQLPFIADKLVLSGATKINSTTLLAVGGNVNVVGYGPATPRYNPIKLFNYVAAELVAEIPLWHPAFGQHTPTALEGVNIISTQNPAKYNFSTQVVNNNSYDPLRPWGSSEVGRVWFDTRNLDYVPYWDTTIFPSRAERLSRWGALADYATIDVYEWVQSAVPPSEYNALALAQAGDADLNPATKAAGEVAGEETYVRDRLWNIRPIAWSYSPVPTAAAHPSFLTSNGVFDAKLDLSTGIAILSTGTFSGYGISAGMRLGAFNNSTVDPQPLSEAIVTTAFTKDITYSSFIPTNVTAPGSSFVADVRVELDRYSSLVGPLVFAIPQASGSISGTPRSDIDGVVVGYDFALTQVVTALETGEEDVLDFDDYFATTNALPSMSVVAGDTIEFKLDNFGLSIFVTSRYTGSVPIDAYRKVIYAALGSQVIIRDAVVLADVVPIPSIVTNSSALSNDPLDQANPNVPMYGWAAWSIPTQSQLDADAKQPNGSWKPYLGQFQYQPGISIAQVQDAVAYAKKPLTLNNGTVINRYQTTWGDWSVLKNLVLTKTQVTTGTLVLARDDGKNIDAGSTSVYVNGITQLKANFEIVGDSLTISSVPAGSSARVIIRKYEPSIEELAFNPTIDDNLTFQQQFKRDYEYVSLPVRDAAGSFSSTVYYFWVKNKTTSAPSKKLSVQAIGHELRDGPPAFMTFQTLDGGMLENPFRYDAIAISGLSYLVGKDDTFKLRFTRNFTLRDDPQQLELKDTHTEWSLIRPGQRSKIPEALWKKLVDSVAGEDAAGNSVPALRRALYDERTGSRTQFGFGPEQTLAPRNLLISSITYTIVNTKLIDSVGATNSPDFISFLNFDNSESWFITPAAARQTLTDIWTAAKPSQINEIFFAALTDILANNYELSDVFKTSRLSAYSIKVITPAAEQQAYE